MSTHNLCFLSHNRKNDVYQTTTVNLIFLYIKWSFLGCSLYRLVNAMVHWLSAICSTDNCTFKQNEKISSAEFKNRVFFRENHENYHNCMSGNTKLIYMNAKNAFSMYFMIVISASTPFGLCCLLFVEKERGEYTLVREAALSKCFLVPISISIYTQRKEFAPVEQITEEPCICPLRFCR